MAGVSVSKSLHLVCGYAGTGKDTLYANLSSGQLRVVGLTSELPSHGVSWLVYAAPGTLIPSFLQEGKDMTRVAFAQALKEESFPYLTLSLEKGGKVSDYEAQKNTLLVKTIGDAPVKSDGEKTLRQYWIEYGEWRRAQHLDYWTAKVSEGARSKIETSHHVMGTDFRFASEAIYAETHFKDRYDTTRVYRSEVKVAPKDVTSEHQLDLYQTTYLLVASPEEFVKALTIFPQYKDYVPICVLAHSAHK